MFDSRRLLIGIEDSSQILWFYVLGLLAFCVLLFWCLHWIDNWYRVHLLLLYFSLSVICAQTQSGELDVAALDLGISVSLRMLMQSRIFYF